MLAVPGAVRGFWDRDVEVAAIEDALAKAQSGDGGVLVVRGSAGIGKSALLRVAGRLAAERGLLVLRARAAPIEREFPYGVVRQLFEPVLARTDLIGEELFSDAAAGAHGVLGGEPVQAAAQDESFASLHALYWLTANLTSRSPLLVCVDDVGWCDQPSLRYLEFLVRRLDGMAVTVAVAYRPDELESSQRAGGLAMDPLARVVTPRPLSGAALAEILADGLEEAALRRANRRAEARVPLREACGIARTARAKPLHDRAVQELRASGERVSRPDATGVDALTASEQRIASMAATGASNRDIAQALFVTIKTVETHLGHVYQKLDITGRGQLARALGEHGTSLEGTLDAQLAGARQTTG